MVLKEEKWVSGVPPEALLGPSGSTFWVPRAIFLVPGKVFLGPLDILFWWVWLFYQLVPTFINFYELLYQSFSISIIISLWTFINRSPLISISNVLHQSLSIPMTPDLHQFLWISINPYRWLSIHLCQPLSVSPNSDPSLAAHANLHQSPSLPTNLYQSVSTSNDLYQSLSNSIPF